jgi:hypothetical protein
VSYVNFDAIAGTLARRLPRRAALVQLAAGAATGLLASAGRVLAQEATPPAGSSAFFVLRRYQLKAGKSMDELVKLVNDGFVPIISKIPGFQDYFLVDAGAGAHMSVSLFADQSGAEASTKAAADWAAANVAPLLEGPAEVTDGWVRIHVTAAGTTESV